MRYEICLANNLPGRILIFSINISLSVHLFPQKIDIA